MTMKIVLEFLYQLFVIVISVILVFFAFHAFHYVRVHYGLSFEGLVGATHERSYFSDTEDVVVSGF